MFASFTSVRLRGIIYSTTAVITLLAFVVVVGYGCKKAAQYPVEPRITSVSVTPNTPLRQNTDSVLIAFTFTDGDGDFGSSDSNTNDINCYLTDTRNGSVTTYSIPYIQQQGVTNGITGTVYIRGLATCCITNGCYVTDAQHPTEAATSKIYIVDRAGHQSNIADVPPMQILCVKSK